MWVLYDKVNCHKNWNYVWLAVNDENKCVANNVDPWNTNPLFSPKLIKTSHVDGSYSWNWISGY